MSESTPGASVQSLSDTEVLEQFAQREYKEGFYTEVEAESAPPGLDEETIAFISNVKKEPDWLLEWRLKAYRNWLKMSDPTRQPAPRQWAMVHYPEIDYQAISYYSAPKRPEDGPQSLDEVDPEILATYDKLGIPLEEQKMLAGVAVDAVFDSVSVATTFKEKLAAEGILFCSFTEAVHDHPDLVRRYLGSVVPANDNFFAALNSAVFTDGSFVYIPKGVRCPMELSTYFRINAANTGQFERTLVIADEGAYVSYLEGCTAPMRDENQLHAAVVELRRERRPRRRPDQVLHHPELVPRRQTAARPRRHLQLRHQERRLPGSARQDQLDPGRDRLGDHLEVPELHPPGRRQRRRVLLGGGHLRPAAGRPAGSRPTPAPR